MLSVDQLISWGGQLRSYSKGKIVFFEGEEARFFYMVATGKIKMINSNDEGKDFIQGIFYEGESFGEPPLFTDDRRYPATAIADADSVLVRLARQDFFKLLPLHYDVHLQITQALANRLRFKTMVSHEIAIHSSEHRLLTMLRYYRGTYGGDNELFEINLTRQELADLTGLRVETVIRAIKELEKKGKLKIVHHKIIIQ